MYTGLVFSGGGLRGFAYIGALKALQETHALQNVSLFAGCSFGAVFATMIAVGYTWEELYDFILHFQYDDLRDTHFLNILESYGIESGWKIQEFIRLMLKRKTGKENLSFQEYWELYQKEIIINGVCINTHSIEYFSHVETPEMPIALALRISLSIPFLFHPVEYKGKLYVDGGVMENLPVRITQERLPEGRILALKLSRGKKMETAVVDSFFSFAEHTWSSLYGELNRLQLEKIHTQLQDRIQVLEIVVNLFHTFNLTPELEQRKEIFQVGYDTVKEFLSQEHREKTEQDIEKKNLVQGLLEDLRRSQLSRGDRSRERLRRMSI